MEPGFVQEGLGIVLESEQITVGSRPLDAYLCLVELTEDKSRKGGTQWGIVTVRPNARWLFDVPLYKYSSAIQARNRYESLSKHF